MSENPKTAVGATKAPLHLVPPALVIETAPAMADGARKYPPYSWRTERVHYSTYVAAMMRHLEALWDGEDNAPDSGISHLGHIGANLAILIDARESGMLVDDRPPKGPAARMIRELKREKPWY